MAFRHAFVVGTSIFSLAGGARIHIEDEFALNASVSGGVVWRTVLENSRCAQDDSRGTHESLKHIGSYQDYDVDACKAAAESDPECGRYIQRGIGGCACVRPGLECTPNTAGGHYWTGVYERVSWTRVKAGARCAQDDSRGTDATLKHLCGFQDCDVNACSQRVTDDVECGDTFQYGIGGCACVRDDHCKNGAGHHVGCACGLIDGGRYWNGVYSTTSNVVWKTTPRAWCAQDDSRGTDPSLKHLSGWQTCDVDCCKERANYDPDCGNFIQHGIGGCACVRPDHDCTPRTEGGHYWRGVFEKFVWTRTAANSRCRDSDMKRLAKFEDANHEQCMQLATEDADCGEIMHYGIGGCECLQKGDCEVQDGGTWWTGVFTRHSPN